MHNFQKPLVIFAVLCLISNSFGAWLSVRLGIPADFGGFLNGHDVLRDFVGINGTALSAPLLFLILQAAFILLALRRGRWGLVGTVGLAILGVIYTIAQSGEPITLRMIQPATFDALQALVLLANILFAAIMALYAILEWRRRRRKPSA